MSQISTIDREFDIGGNQFSSTSLQTAEVITTHVGDLPAGIAGTLASNGVDNLPTGHYFVQGDRFDIHWTDPIDGSHKARWGFDVGLKHPNDIVFNPDFEGEGDSLPAVGTSCVATKWLVIPIIVNNDFMKMVALKTTRNALITFRNLQAENLWSWKLTKNGGWMWSEGMGLVSPLDGIFFESIVVTNGSTMAGVATFAFHYNRYGD